MRTSEGHELLSAKAGEYVLKSTRYPFCGCEPETMAAAKYPACEKDSVESDASIRSGMTLVPFEQELNRLTLVARNGSATRYKVTWGQSSHEFSKDQLEQGINLARAFPENPFSEAFAKVDTAVAAKQAFETKQIKQLFRSPEAKADMEGVVAQSEAERSALVKSIKAAFVPVTHTLKIEPAQ